MNVVLKKIHAFLSFLEKNVPIYVEKYNKSVRNKEIERKRKIENTKWFCCFDLMENYLQSPFCLQ